MAESLIFNLDVNSTEAVASINKFFSTFDQGAAQAKARLNTAFNQNLQTTVDISFKNGEVVAKKIQNIKQESQRLGEVHKAVNGELGRTPAKLREQLTILKGLRDKTEKFSRSTGKVTQDWKTLTARISAANTALGKMGQGGSFMGKLKQGLTSFAPMLTLIQTASNLATAAIMNMISAIGNLGPAMIERAKDVENLKLTLSGFLDSEKEVASVMASSKAIALTYGADLGEVEKAYKRLTPTIIAAGGSLKDTEQVIVAMTARTTQLGLNAEQTSRYMEAIAQVFGKGKLQAEELTKQLSQMDGALRSQLDAYVKNNTEFTSLVEAMDAGAVTAEVFKNAFIEVSNKAVKKLAGEIRSLQKSFDDLTIQQVQNKMNTLNTLSLDSLNNTFKGFGDSILRSGAALSQFGASITNDMPELTAAFKELMDQLGFAWEVIVNGFLVGVKIILKALDMIRGGFRFLGDVIKKIPGMDRLIQGTKNWQQSMKDSFREGVDLILSTGPALEKSIGLMEELEGSVGLTAKQYEDLAAKAKDAYDKQLKGLDDYLKLVKSKGDEEKQDIKDRMDLISESIAEEKEKYKDLKEIVKSKYDEEETRIDQKLEKLKQAYDLERGEINAKTDAEKKLEAIRRNELDAKMRNTALSEKERLEAQVALEAMDKRLRLAALDKRYKEDKNKLDEESAANDKAREEHMDRIENQNEKQLEMLKKKLDLEKKAIKEIDDEYRELASTVRRMKDEEAGLIAANRTAAISSINAQITALGRLKAARQQAEANAASANGDAPANDDVRGVRFAGGPVSGGSSYTVNELGREAFLSASGKLSMINAPAFGTWKAPASGTVIPAHLTKQLSVPKGGVNLNSAAKINASGTSPGGDFTRLAGAVLGMSRDNVTNNVTIQSANTNQTASDVMVQLAKLKRLRYN